jgi:hypothetical protein
VGGSADDRPEQAAKPGGHRGGRDANAELAKAARTDHSSAFDRSCGRPQCAATSAAESDQSSSPEPSRLARVWGEGGGQAGPFAGQQVSVDHLTEQGVTEVVAFLAGSGH